MDETRQRNEPPPPPPNRTTRGYIGSAAFTLVLLLLCDTQSQTQGPEAPLNINRLV